MTAVLAASCGVAVGIGVWLVVVGLRRTPVTTRPPRTEASFAGVLRLVGMDRHGRLYAHRRALALGVFSGLVVATVTGWYVLVVVIPTVLVGLPSLFRRTTTSSDVERLTDLTAWVRSLVGVLSGGAVGLEQAIRATLHSAPPTVRPAVARLVARLEAQQPVKEALRRWADEMDDYSADLIAAALILESDNRHGAIGAALRQLAGSLTAQARARRAIETERASGRATVRWVTIVTLVVLGGASTTGYLDGYRSPVGQVIALVLFAAYVGCLMWMRQISLGRPVPRFLPADGREVG